MAITYINDDASFSVNIDNTGETDVTQEIQTILDKVSDGGTVIFDSGMYRVSKNTGLTDFPNNDQPCLLVRNKNNLKIEGQGAKLFVEQHAQGILEIQLSSNLTIEGLEIQGYGNFPPIDVTSDGYTGYGEKGTDKGGYDTDGYWGYYKNNNHDTSGNTEHASIKNGLPWGTFGGGFIGNVSFGILIHRGCSRINLYNLNVHGFNYVGIGVGFNGDFFPTNLQYADSEDILIQECYLHDNYDANLHVLASERTKAINCISERAGHPDASLNNNVVDPGYGITLRGTNCSKAKSVVVEGCSFKDNKRKGIDSHSGIGVIFNNNLVENSWADGIFARTVNNTQQSKEIIITNNTVINCSIMKNAGNSVNVGGPNGGSSLKSDAETNVIITNNILKDNGATVIYVGSFDKAIVEGNIISGVSSTTQNTSFYGIVMGKSSGDRSTMMNVSNNLIDAKGNTFFVRGIQVQNVDDGTVIGNVIKMEHANANIGIYTIANGYVNYIGNHVKLGTSGIPLALSQTNGAAIGNTSIGGSAAYKLTHRKGDHFRSR